MINRKELADKTLKYGDSLELKVFVHDLDNYGIEESEVPGQVPERTKPDIICFRERTISISVADESFNYIWHSRVRRFLRVVKKIHPFGKKKEDL